MIAYEQARAIVLRESAPLPSERIAAHGALGRVLAVAVASPGGLPPFDNSAMDGFALRTGGMPAAAGSEVAVFGSQAAGDPATTAEEGAWEIMTGARIPDGLDAVIPVERVEVLARDGAERPSRIRLLEDVPRGLHIRRRGEDVAPGAALMAPGTRVAPQQLMLLAALGIPQVGVHRRPRVSLLATGRELVDAPRPLQPGEIRDSNSPFLQARLEAAGAQLVLRETVDDDPAAFRAALRRAVLAGSDIVISTGAVSMGRHDFVPGVLREDRAQLHFHKVGIRPGKPLLFARLAEGPLYFGLPGNPVASVVCLRFFVEPVLRRMLGMAPEQPLRVPLAERFGKGHPLRTFLKARLDCDSTGQLRARVLAGQESFRIAPLLATGAWIVVPEDAGELEAGSLVEVHGLGHLEPPTVEMDSHSHSHLRKATPFAPCGCAGPVPGA